MTIVMTAVGFAAGFVAGKVIDNKMVHAAWGKLVAAFNPKKED
jgi:hypothetical protein